MGRKVSRRFEGAVTVHFLQPSGQWAWDMWHCRVSQNNGTCRKSASVRSDRAKIRAELVAPFSPLSLRCARMREDLLLSVNLVFTVAFLASPTSSNAPRTCSCLSSTSERGKRELTSIMLFSGDPVHGLYRGTSYAQNIAVKYGRPILSRSRHFLSLYPSSFLVSWRVRMPAVALSPSASGRRPHVPYLALVISAASLSGTVSASLSMR